MSQTGEFKDCRIVSAVRAEKHFGKQINSHIVYRLGLVPVGADDDADAYWAEFPVMLVPGFDWDFFDEQSGRGVWRKTTNEDTAANIERVEKCFPAWKAYCDGLEDGNEALALAWFTDRNLTEGVTVRAKLSVRTYNGIDGMEHESRDAKIYAPFEQKPLLEGAEAANVIKAMKAAGFRLGKGGANAAKKPTPPKRPSAPVPPPAPSKPKISLAEAKDKAWEAYADIHMDDDPQMAKAYERAAEVLKRAPETFESWTVNDWLRIADEWAQPPF